ncbi:MAG: hypothetical protein IPN71_00465 [Fibrobacteres bacterium]|nr:hypothetical protein [Fibrobacterota bacterium]
MLRLLWSGGCRTLPGGSAGLKVVVAIGLATAVAATISCTPKEVAMVGANAGQGTQGEFAAVDFWSNKAQDAIDAAQRRRDGTPYAFLAGPSRVDLPRRRTVPLIACQGGTSADFAQGSLLAQGVVLLVDPDRGGLAAASLNQKDYSRELAEEPPMTEAETLESGFGSACSEVDLVRLFPRSWGGDGRYKVWALHPGGLVEGISMEVRGAGKARTDASGATSSTGRENPMPPDAWAVDEPKGEGAIGFSLALDTSAGNPVLRASVPVGAATGERNVHVAGMDRSGRFVVWTLALPATESHTHFRLDLSRLFPSVRASGGVVVGIWEGVVTESLPISPAGPQGSEP